MGMIGNSLAQGLISGANIQDGTVDTPDLKDSSVTTAKVADGAVTNAKINDVATSKLTGTVSTSQIAGAAVTAAKLGSTAITDKLGYTPLNKAGDTMTGPLVVPSVTNTFSTVLSDYRTLAPTADNIMLVGASNDRDCWLYRDPAGGVNNWGIYHRNIDTQVGGLPGNSIGFVGGNQLAAYIDLENRRIRSMTAMDQPYQMVVRMGGYTVPDGFSDIVYDVLIHSRWMSHNSGTNMVFEQPGKYLITTGWRFGSGGDVWTGVRLRDTDGTVRGLGYATGQINSGDPGPCQISFIADIPASRLGQSMRMQFIRAGSTMGIASPAESSYGYAIVTTVVQIGV